ncbi:F-box protein [Quillaja saponaria]|uniref:F-box protein n=1 Tax=Quillaja saponaria TaxID=32244 RepID=A0AAD7QH37_QUISA|nr:F-box protein [Quillaja saponaria]
MGSRARTGKWSDLPKDLLALITAKHLNSRPDILRVRAVCSSWRSSISLSNNSTPCFPLRVPVPTCLCRCPCSSFCFLLTESILYLIQAPDKIPEASNSESINKVSWLVRVEHSAEPGKLRCADPLDPSIFVNPSGIPKLLNLLEYRVSEVSRFYGLKFVGIKKLGAFFSLIDKVVVSSNSDKFSVMALYGHRFTKLIVWKMGDDDWTLIENGCLSDMYIDIAYHNGKFSAMDITGQIMLVDFSSLQPITITSVAPPEMPSVFQSYKNRGRYLVNSVGNLLLVSNTGERDHRAHFKVHKLDEEKQMWIPVVSLGDQVLFLDTKCSLSVSAQDLIGFGCKRNCIYFIFYGYTWDCAYEGFNTWMFDLKLRSVKLVPRVPDKPHLLLSPQPWLRRSKRLKKI